MVQGVRRKQAGAAAPGNDSGRGAQQLQQAGRARDGGKAGARSAGSEPAPAPGKAAGRGTQRRAAERAARIVIVARTHAESGDIAQPEKREQPHTVGARFAHTGTEQEGVGETQYAGASDRETRSKNAGTQLAHTAQRQPDVAVEPLEAHHAGAQFTVEARTARRQGAGGAEQDPPPEEGRSQPGQPQEGRVIETRIIPDPQPVFPPGTPDPAPGTPQEDPPGPGTVDPAPLPEPMPEPSLPQRM